MTEIRNILVPTDYSPHAEKALAYAIGLAKTFGAKIHLLHAYRLPEPMPFPATIAVPESFWEEVHKHSMEKLEEVRQQVAAESIECEVEAVREPPFPAVVDSAERLDADLIVMGTRGLTGLKHVMLGSVAERTVRLAHCPVITLKDSEA